MEAIIVEDSEAAAALLRSYLKKMGYKKIQIGYNAKQGLKILRDAINNPMSAAKLVFVDWVMPQMDGLDFFKAAQEFADAETHFIMVTAKSDKASVKNAITAGFHGYLVKPYTQDSLAKMINIVRGKLAL
ncbi:MAG: response regulator [Pseudomonadota bacterium]